MGSSRETRNVAESIFDVAELLARVDSDRELLLDLLQIFKQECGPLLLTLRKAVSKKDMREVEITSHTLKGMLASLAASRAATAAATLEQLGKRLDRAGLKQALIAFESEVAILIPQVDAYMERTGQ